MGLVGLGWGSGTGVEGLYVELGVGVVAGVGADLLVLRDLEEG